jgi:hypothetical protein
MGRPDPGVIGGHLAVTEGLDPIQIGARQHPVSDRGGVHGVVVGVAAHVVIAR